MGNCNMKKESDITSTLSKNNFRQIHVIGKGGFGKVTYRNFYNKLI
jgi:hypothetical protein